METTTHYALTIVTDNIPVPILRGEDLTEDELQEFDHISDEDLYWEGFIRYRGNTYHIGDFSRCRRNGLNQGAWNDWDQYIPDTAFSGVLIKYIPNDLDHVIVGHYYS
jgi:hypothetical protein